MIQKTIKYQFSLTKNISKLPLEIIKIQQSQLKDWKITESKIQRQYEFQDFNESFTFMTHVAHLADSAQHHPEWFNVYNKVTWNTHDVSGLTRKDLISAKICDIIHDKIKANGVNGLIDTTWISEIDQKDINDL